MSTPGLITCAVSFVAGMIFTAKVGWKLGVFTFVALLLTAISFYLALGWLPGFVDWMRGSRLLDPSIRFLLFSGLIFTSFFLGTGAVRLFNEIRRAPLSDARDQHDRSGQ